MGACNSGVIQEEKDLNLLDYEQEIKHFYVITAIYNPCRSRDRIKLYLNFRKKMEQMGVKLITVECAYDKAPFTVTIANYEPYNIQVRSPSPIFVKECLINRAISVLPADARYVCWVDFEVEFLNTNWVTDTIKTLNQFKIAQLCEEIAW
eukprot:CAMPEP_0176429526 /NCGR_PEP_ID=MMETSP0127-20121128/13759_1 /TAXON_ID=938130 /ORGANISM="Platyophrya macrostoma, Strain WH" /LENGTH=149 /DNA_ID=CAMNT_0017811339 /DNA_START=81 /DNA_END=527 /DNA_ORIENTATION=-